MTPSEVVGSFQGVAALCASYPKLPRATHTTPNPKPFWTEDKHLEPLSCRSTCLATGTYSPNRLLRMQCMFEGLLQLEGQAKTSASCLPIWQVWLRHLLLRCCLLPGEPGNTPRPVVLSQEESDTLQSYEEGILQGSRSLSVWL